MLRTLLSCLLLAALGAADPWTDPLADMSQTRALQTLWQLRAPLAAAPDDQRLLGVAIEALVNLCVVVDHDDAATLGPWLERARDLARRRAAARGGRAAASLAEAAPELWVLAMERRTRAVMEALAAWPGEADTPPARALRVYCTRDTRILDGRAALTPRERHARLVARAEHWELGRGDEVSAEIDALIADSAGLEPVAGWVLQQVHRRTYVYQNIDPGVPRRCLAGVATMLRCPDLAEADALAAAAELARGLGRPPPAGLDRAALQHHLETAVLARDPATGAAWSAAFAICDRILAATKPGQELGDLADCARWNRQRLDWGSRWAGFAAEERMAETLAAMRSAAGDSLGFMRALFDRGNNREEFAAYAAALGRSDPTRDSPWVIARSARDMGDDANEITVPALQRVLDHARAAGHYAIPWALISEVANMAGAAGLANDLLREASAADPWNTALLDAARLRNGLQPMPVPPGEPAATWTDAIIDATGTPWPNLKASRDFAVAWEGRLRITAPGNYRLGLASDDAGRLMLGSWCLDHPGPHPQYPLSGVVALAAGDHPLRVWFAQQGGGAGCQLLWQPPGAEALVPVPAEALVQADGRPGLAARGWTTVDARFACQGPDPVLVEAALAQPWLPLLQLQAERATVRAEHALADRLLEAALAIGDAPWIRRMQLLNELGKPVSDRARVADLLGRDSGWPTMAMPLWYAETYDYIAPSIFWQDRLVRVEQLGLVREALAAPTARKNEAVVGRANAHLAIGIADIPAAVRYLGMAIDPQRVYIGVYGRARMVLERAILARALGSEPDWPETLRRIQDLTPSPDIALSVAAIANATTEAELVTLMAAIPDGDVALYYRGLYRLTIGDHEGARKDLGAVVARHANWFECYTARNLLDWYAAASPAQLAALPRATPIEPAGRLAFPEAAAAAAEGAAPEAAPAGGF